MKKKKELELKKKSPNSSLYACLVVSILQIAMIFEWFVLLHVATEKPGTGPVGPGVPIDDPGFHGVYVLCRNVVQEYAYTHTHGSRCH